MMKKLKEYIIESIKPLPKSVSGLIVFDIDDTLLRVKPDSIKIYKKDPNTGKEITLTTDEFARDADAVNHKDWFDYRDFNNADLVYKSIIEGTPLIKNLKIMDAYLQAGYDFCFLTARGCEDIVKQALKDFLRYKDTDGQLKALGKKFKDTLSHAVNDITKEYHGETDAIKKSNILKKLCKSHDAVVFVDDDAKNLQWARSLKLPNLKIIPAWKD